MPNSGFRFPNVGSVGQTSMSPSLCLLFSSWVIIFLGRPYTLLPIVVYVLLGSLIFIAPGIVDIPDLEFPSPHQSKSSLMFLKYSVGTFNYITENW